MKIVDQYFEKLKSEKRKLWRNTVVLTALAFLVAFAVSWNLRLTGITIANEATCEKEEHTHTEQCTEEILICGQQEEYITGEEEQVEEEPIEEETVVDETVEEKTIEEEPVVEEPAVEEPAVEEPLEDELLVEESQSSHVHTEECFEIVYVCDLEEHIHELLCYSDISADVETAEQWIETIPELSGVQSDDIIQVANSQLGNGESELNFELAEDGETRKGITRYGQWYGNAYGDWATMFTSFCLYYAEVADAPLNAGAETMRLEWADGDIYRPKANYEPLPGRK